MSLDFSCDIQMVGWEFGTNNMRAWLHPALYQRSKMMVVEWCGGSFPGISGALSTSWASFKRHSLPEYCFWPCPSLYDHSVLSSDGYFQQDNASHHKVQIMSNWFLEHDNEFSVLQWPPQSPDLNPTERLWDVVEWGMHIMDVQICSNCMMLSCRGMFPAPCWIYAMKN